MTMLADIPRAYSRETAPTASHQDSIASSFTAMNQRAQAEERRIKARHLRAVAAGILIGFAVSHAALTTIENLSQTLTDCSNSSASITAEEASR
ncbi:hypothetical protein FGG78_20720 [Thioclava sp. BHET1]|nr:hypothetical protein FGG78_20720 [Thioclava sp. BHET1]